MAEKEARLVDRCTTFYKGAFPSIASVTSLLDGFKTHSIQGIIRPYAQHQRLYEEHRRRDNGRFKNSRISFLCTAWKMRKRVSTSSTTHLFVPTPLHPKAQLGVALPGLYRTKAS